LPTTPGKNSLSSWARGSRCVCERLKARYWLRGYDPVGVWHKFFINATHLLDDSGPEPFLAHVPRTCFGYAGAAIRIVCQPKDCLGKGASVAWRKKNSRASMIQNLRRTAHG